MPICFNNKSVPATLPSFSLFLSLSFSFFPLLFLHLGEFKMQLPLPKKFAEFPDIKTRVSEKRYIEVALFGNIYLQVFFIELNMAWSLLIVA
jgi:hypothetical protein